MTDRVVPVFDGIIPDDPDVVPVLMPTQANIDAVREAGDYAFAFDLMLSKLGMSSVEALNDGGVSFAALWDGKSPEALASEGDNWPAALALALEQLGARESADHPQVTAAVKALSYVAELQLGREQLGVNERRIWMLAALAAAGAGQAAASLGLGDVAPPAAAISDHFRKLQALSRQSTARWRPVAADYLKANIIPKQPHLSDNRLAIAVEEASPEILTTLRRLGLPDRRQVAVWVGEARRTGVLPPRVK